MSRSTRMKQLVAVVLEGDVDGVTRALLDEGVMHFINMRTLWSETPTDLHSYRTDDMRDGATALRKRVEILLKAADIPTPQDLDISKLHFVQDGHAASDVNRVEQGLAALRKQTEEIKAERKQLLDISRQVDLFGDFSGGLPTGSRFSYLDLHTGSVPADRAAPLTAALAAMPAVSVTLKEDAVSAYLFLIGIKRDEKLLAEVLDGHGWQDVDLNSELGDAGKGVHEDIGARLGTLDDRDEELAAEIKKTVLDSKETLVELWSNLRMNELYGVAQSFYSRTARTILFTGWVPEKAEAHLDSRIREACTQRCYLEWHVPKLDSADEVPDVPVRLKNPKFLKPFELLVRNYAVPAYGTIDPTPLVAIAYLVMFGLMFGDAGHGLVLLLAGTIGRKVYRKQNNVRDILSLLVYCGAASIITGALFGSYFGFQIFKPIWFDYHGIVAGHGGGPLVSDIYDVLAITIYFGIAVIGLGILLNWVNLIKRRQWFTLVFDKAGLLGGFIYGAGIWVTSGFVASGYRTLPPGRLLFLLLGIPVLLLAFKAPLHHLRTSHSKMHPMLFVDFIMDWIVEILEVFSGYLANTLSFMRVAGLGIAHEALLIAFFQIARMTGGGTLAGIGPILILLVGNVLIVGLEGLSAGIQSLRLNYYEFFSKYFNGTGRSYDPISLRGTRNGG